jgi:hypothetical protein
VHFEPWFASGASSPVDGERLDEKHALEGVAEALGSLATFGGADEVIVGRVTPQRLSRPLSALARSQRSS